MAVKLSKRDTERIIDAIKTAETKSSGRIRVHIRQSLEGDLMKEAVDKFNELGLAGVEGQIGVLIFIARDDRQLTIIGDECIHEKVGDKFWSEAVAAMVEHFKSDDFTGGIEAGIFKVGEALSTLRKPNCESPITFS